MVKRISYLIVEGPQDIAFVARILKTFAIKVVNKKSSLNPFWNNLIPKTFPVDDDLLKRVPIPAFFESDAHSIAIHAAQGLPRLVKTLEETRAILDFEKISSYGFLLDADDTQTPVQRFNNLLSELQKSPINIPLSANPGEIVGSAPSFGVFILPDNQNPGTLEDILLQAAQVNYSQLFMAAGTFIQSVDKNQLVPKDIVEFNKPSGDKKARVSSISSILKPGRAIQNSIQDNRWLDGEAMNLPVMQSVSVFLQQLLDLK